MRSSHPRRPACRTAAADEPLRAAQLITAVDDLQANRRRTAIMQEVARVMAAADALLFTKLSLDSRTSINPVISLTGHPSIAVPIGLTAAGSPTGIMFSGQLYREGELLALARAVGRAAAVTPRYRQASVRSRSEVALQLLTHSSRSSFRLATYRDQRDSILSNSTAFRQ